jgi:hypothetical protein
MSTIGNGLVTRLGMHGSSIGLEGAAGTDRNSNPGLSHRLRLERIALKAAPDDVGCLRRKFELIGDVNIDELDRTIEFVPRSNRVFDVVVSTNAFFTDLGHIHAVDHPTSSLLSQFAHTWNGQRFFGIALP